MACEHTHPLWLHYIGVNAPNWQTSAQYLVVLAMAQAIVGTCQSLVHLTAMAFAQGSSVRETGTRVIRLSRKENKPAEYSRVPRLCFCTTWISNFSAISGEQCWPIAGKRICMVTFGRLPITMHCTKRDDSRCVR